MDIFASCRTYSLNGEFQEHWLFWEEHCSFFGQFDSLPRRSSFELS